MKVILISQVFSRTVAAAINTHVVLGALPAEAVNTIYIDELFDVLTAIVYFFSNPEIVQYLIITTILNF